MESVELLIYLGIAVIIGAMVLGFITGWDYFGAFEGFKKMMNDDVSLGFKKVDRNEFAGMLYSFFQDCVSQDENMSMSLYLKETGSFTKSDLFVIYKGFGWCDTIQSAQEGCGYREDLTMLPLAVPRIVAINCTDNHLVVS
jgi:hypothetical protein